MNNPCSSEMSIGGILAIFHCTVGRPFRGSWSEAIIMDQEGRSDARERMSMMYYQTQLARSSTPTELCEVWWVIVGTDTTMLRTSERFTGERSKRNWQLMDRATGLGAV